MPAITKKDSRLQLQFLPNSDHSIHAGLVALEAMARRFDLWNKLRQLPGLDPRRDKKRGYGPEVIVGQLIYALCSGGGCLSDSEALNDDPLARELFGVEKFADQSQVGEWLREQSEESVTALRRLLHEFVAWVWQQADPRRLLHAGQCEVFFDDTQLEVTGKCFEGADFNYNKQLALSWQTLWVGPLLADSHLGRPGDVSDQLLPMLERNRDLWKGKPAHFYADRQAEPAPPCASPQSPLGQGAASSPPKAGTTRSVTTAGPSRWNASPRPCRRAVGRPRARRTTPGFAISPRIGTRRNCLP